MGGSTTDNQPIHPLPPPGGFQGIGLRFPGEGDPLLILPWTMSWSPKLFPLIKSGTL